MSVTFKIKSVNLKLYFLTFILVVTTSVSEASSIEQVEYSYGTDALQKLDFWPATSHKLAPLIVFVHGGGWKRGDKKNATGMAKIEHLINEGFAFASLNYRLVPKATVEQQASDVAVAIAWFHSNAERLGVDTSRIILLGHSAGAHLVALVGTDPQYLAAVGQSLADLRGIILFDGASYDVAQQIMASGFFMRRTYVQAFGNNLERQRALSPTLQAAAPNAQAFLIVHIDRADGAAQSTALARSLMQQGTSTEIYALEGKGVRGHIELNNAFGRADAPVTAIVDVWLRNRLATD